MFGAALLSFVESAGTVPNDSCLYLLEESIRTVPADCLSLEIDEISIDEIIPDDGEIILDEVVEVPVE